MEGEGLVFPGRYPGVPLLFIGRICNNLAERPSFNFFLAVVAGVVGVQQRVHLRHEAPQARPCEPAVMIKL